MALNVHLDIERISYTPAEVAAAAGLSRKAVYRAIETGELRAARVCGGSRLLIPTEAVEEWFAGNVVSPRPLPKEHAATYRRQRGVLGEALGPFDHLNGGG